MGNKVVKDVESNVIRLQNLVLMDETKPVLEKEIFLFEKVNQLLKALFNGEKLVEEDQDEVKSFISLADQANPTKVNNVVTLVEGLIATAKADIAKAVKDCDNANAAVGAAGRVYKEAVGTCAPLTSKLARTTRSLQNARGELDAAKVHVDHRTPLIQSEIESLKKVISLVRSVD